MLILLTHANHLFADRKQVAKMQPYPPLQALIAASVLRREGHEVALHDSTFDRDFRAALERTKPDLIAVCEDNFNFLTKMCLLENRELAFEIAGEARRQGIPVVANSSDATDQAEAYLKAGFDLVIQGELEETLREVCSRGVNTTLAGTARLNVGAVEYGAPRAPIADLDQLPPAAWDLVDIEQYRRAWLEAHGYFSLNLATSRGCPYHCNWCAKPVYGDTYRHYSADRVAAEIECVQDLFAPDQLWFADDIFGLSGKWTREFAACLAQRGARVPFRMQSRCDLMTRDTVEALARAGCMEVWMGVESGSQKILDAMEKGTRVEQVRAARENLRQHGIRCCYFLQFGYLGEEWEDIEATVRLVRETGPDDIGVSVSYPLPNTRFHQIVHNEIGTQTNWRDSADLRMTFQGAFSSDFYSALSGALHLEVGGQARADEVRAAWDRVEQLRCACC